MRFSFFATASAFFLLFFTASHAARAAQQPHPPSAEDLIRRMEARRGSWTGFKARVSMHFLSPEKKGASCEGTLAYHRLDEKILLRCFDPQGQNLFVFRTSDREFELHLPALKTLFRGNIFDLEESPDIQSHLRAQDLYRALKPMAVPFKNTEAETRPEGGAFLKIFHTTPGGRKLSRKIRLNAEGDPLMELYYHPVSGKPVVSIHRSEFKQADGTSSSFPYHLLIKSNPVYSPGIGLSETTVDFKSLQFFSELSGHEFEDRPEEGTRVIEIGGLKKA